MKKIILLTALLLPVALFSCKKDHHASNPYKGKECVTLDVTNIGPVGATFNGYFDPKQSSHWIGYYFLVGFDEAGCDIDSLLNGKEHRPFGAYDVLPPEGADQVILPSNHKLKRTAGLPFSDTTYFVRALIYCVDTVLQKEWFVQADNIKRFSTKTLNMKTVTKDASDISYFTAVLNGQVETNAGKDASIQTQFILGLGSASLDKLLVEGISTGWKELDPAGDLSFSDSLKITCLESSTTYSYVACARLGAETYYGEVKSFTTADYNPVVTALPAEAGPVKAKLKGSISPSHEGASQSRAWFLLGAEGSTLESLLTSGTRLDAYINNDNTTFETTTPLLEMSKTYCFAACVRVNGRETYSPVATFTTTTRTVPADAVEMGLSVLWSKKNIGADSPGGYGGHYAWGEIETKGNYERNTYKWNGSTEGGSYSFTKYNSSEVWGPVVDNKYRLDPEDDAATAVLGAPWRMPTSGEWRELIDYCDWEKKEVDGHQGYQITSRITGQSIFLVSVGYRSGDDYLSSSLYYFAANRPDGFVCYAINDNNGNLEVANFWRHCGTNIRAVRE